MSVELTDSQELGVNFALVDKLATTAAVSGSGSLINAAGGFLPAQVLSTTAPQPGVPPYIGDRPNQLISGYQADQGLKFGFVGGNVSGFVRALETFNKTDILASPRVLVLNKQKAEIQLGRRLGFRNTVTNLTSSLQTVQFLSVGTLLSLRPYVSGDGMIRLEIHPEKSSGIIDQAGIPQTNTSELTTNILVPDGATIVIGGLIDNQDELVEQGVLGVSRLPLIGPLFRTRAGRATKRELIVLLTPRVLRRDGLPPPFPGIAPAGPSMVPNSGPMPGPSYLMPGHAGVVGGAPHLISSGNSGSGTGLQDPQRTLRPDLLNGNSGPAAAAAEKTPGGQNPSIPPHPGRPPSRELGTTRDPGVMPAASPELRPGPSVLSEELPELPGNQPYARPRATADRHSSGPAQVATPPSLSSTPAPTVSGPTLNPADSRRLPARPGTPADRPVPSQILHHVVRPGEDFASISAHYYGSTSLRAPLWSVNRRWAPTPDQLRPGTTIVIPPREHLELLVHQALSRPPASQHPPRSEPTRKKWFRPFSAKPRQSE